MSPMGEYKNFEDCVSKNQDKDNPEAYCGSIKAKVEGEHKANFKKKVKALFKKCKAKLTKKSLSANWKKAKLTGLAQLPDMQKKHIEGKTAKYSHGKELPQTAFHSIGMTNYAELDVCFLKEGEFRTNGIPYKYEWEVIERDGKSFEGKGFFLNHDEFAGKEMGIIDKVYTAIHAGVNWMCATVKVPETEWTKAFLERVQTGLIHDVSSTHDFYVSPDDPSRKVSKMIGKGLSAVKEGEVSNARILNIRRNLR